MQELHVDDAGFVRAPASLVHRRVVDVASWPSWWDVARVRPGQPVGRDEVWLVELRGARARRLRWSARPHGWRTDRGMLMALEGDLRGWAEFWLEPTHGGTIVHHILMARTAVPRPDRVVTDYRRALRRGLWGLKDTLHLEARTSAGLVP